MLSQICVSNVTYLLADVIIDHLKEWLIKEWRRFDQNIIVYRAVVNQWRDRPPKNVSARTSDLNSLTVSTDISCVWKLLAFSSVIKKFEMSEKTGRISV